MITKEDYLQVQLKNLHVNPSYISNVVRKEGKSSV